MGLALALLCSCQLAAASAPDSLTAASLISLARLQRYQQDSALSDYTAIAKQRWTAGIGLASLSGLGPAGRTRTAARFESVVRMHWHHQLGGFAEMLAARGAAPIVGEMEPSAATADVVFVLPYAPGRDQLWPMSELQESLPDGREWIAHPLASGSDSLYTFALGGALAITLPDGRTLQLREVHVRPRRPDERLIVGSLWLDIASGALVRAAYRPSAELDLYPLLSENVDAADRELFRRFGPYRANVEEVVIEHGLYAGRFWLPRARLVYAEGTARMGRATFGIEQTFSYEAVRAMGPGETQARVSDTVPLPKYGDAFDMTVINGRRVVTSRRCGDRRSDAQGLSLDSIATLSNLARRRVSGTAVNVLFPCDVDSLVSSPLLPSSLFEAGEGLFTETDLNRLRREMSTALAMDQQATYAPQPVQWTYGLNDGLTRFNRIEGLSLGVRGEKPLGNGFQLSGTARLGVADLEPNVEVGVVRSSGSGQWRVNAYRRLNASNDWGAPLGTAASFGALILGTDYGMYSRSHGVELSAARHRIATGRTIGVRAFVERQEAAEKTHDFAIGHWIDGADFPANLVATAATFGGIDTRISGTLGNDPRRLQVSGELATEAATGPGDYLRVRGETRLARRLGSRNVLALVLAAGSSSGNLPPQREYLLGGPWTLHAQRVGEVRGESFWFSRTELGRDFGALRLALFSDLGWAGPRQAFAASADRRASAGTGVSLLDGLLRFDVSARVEGRPRWTVDLAIDVR